ncbi:riboflavin synthase [Candidatus Pantoea carbekii]|uniref:riboflavin synthase n=1 Tax=Candidatus Pantoea carbekii TaxID=1235990 RepID=UPI0006187B09|nr:riboflavin synthase [Candidatus Pantoea carbekii]AKC32092.1 riboflavin synthase alpha chain ribE [Candidatus Pantoea carbekii]
MFTGIVQGIAKIVAVEENKLLRTHLVKLPKKLLPDLVLGASIAHNGCCLSVTHLQGDLAKFDLIKETLRITNLLELQVGDLVNVERAAKFSDEIGGHVMSGHIITTAVIYKIVKIKNNYELWCKLKDSIYMKYILCKGFIGLDGISLTIANITNNKFCVYLIPETLSRTILATKKVGDKVNVEVDFRTQAIVDTVERVLTQSKISVVK